VRGRSNQNPFDFIERHRIASSIVEPRRLARRMGGDPLGVFEETAVRQIRRDAGGPHGVATDRSGKVCLACPAFYHRENFATVDASGCELSLPVERTKERHLRLVADARCGHVFIEILFERVMRRDRVTLAPFLAEVDPHAAGALFVVFDVHRRHRSDAGEGEEHRRYQRSVAFAGNRGNVNRIEKLPGLFGGQYRRSANSHDMLRSAHRGRWIHRDDPPRDQPVEEHLQGGEFLFDAWSVDFRPEFFDVGRDEERTDVAEPDAAFLTPVAEVTHRPAVGFAGIPVADRDREELDQPPTRMLTRIPKQLRESVESRERNLTSRENEGVVSHAGEGEESDGKCTP